MDLLEYISQAYNSTSTSFWATNFRTTASSSSSSDNKSSEIGIATNQSTAVQSIQQLISEHYCASGGGNCNHWAIFYGLVCQLVLALALNSVILCSILKHRIFLRTSPLRAFRHHRSHHRKSNNGECGGGGEYSPSSNSERQRQRKMPVIDIIVTILSGISLLRALVRSALQVACFYGKWRRMYT